MIFSDVSKNSGELFAHLHVREVMSITGALTDSAQIEKDRALMNEIHFS